MEEGRPTPARKICILISDRCAGVALRVKRRLPSLRLPAEIICPDGVDIHGILAEQPIDALILSREEFDLAAELASRSYAGVLLLCDRDDFERLAPACLSTGVLLAELGQLETALPNLLALCERLRYQRDKANNLRRQLDDTRVVSRAKLLLMYRLKMSENEAHRYIEKTAMDSGMRRREVAEGIIRAYEE